MPRSKVMRGGASRRSSSTSRTRQRLERLTVEVSQWRKARDLRAYAQEALADLGDGDVTTAEGESLRDELQWALDYADRVDPLHGRD